MNPKSFMEYDKEIELIKALINESRPRLNDAMKRNDVVIRDRILWEQTGLYNELNKLSGL
jgi:hypothetical protein